MFKRAFRQQAAPPAADPQRRVDKSARLTKRAGGGGSGTGNSNGSFSARDAHRLSTRLQRSFSQMEARGGDEAPTADHGLFAGSPPQQPQSAMSPSPIITLAVGREGRLFAAHEDVLCQSPFFREALSRRSPYVGNTDPASGSTAKRTVLSHEEPEIFSAVLEYLYKGDYYPRLLQSKHRGSWELEDASPSPNSPQMQLRRGQRSGGGQHQQQHGILTPEASPDLGCDAAMAAATSVEPTVCLTSMGQHLLRDTVIYCAAEQYGLEELKRLALRKQGLQSGIDVATILRSAQYCYAHTPDTDSRLRAHYLALLIRCRKTFKRSGTMQAEMEKGGEGGKLYFDLFVALCNHLDDVIDASNARTPRTI